MKPQHIAICNELRKLIRSGRIEKIVVVSLDGKELTVYKLNKKSNEGEKK